jgi:O-antigen ligase
MWERGTDVMNLSLRKNNLKDSLLAIYCFYLGLGIEFPYIFLFGNLGPADVIIFILFLAIIKKDSRFPKIAIIPILIGVIYLISYYYNLLFSGYYTVGLEPFGIVIRWFYFALMIYVFFNVLTSYRQVLIVLKSLLIGGVILLIYAWINWSEYKTFLNGIPVFSWIRNLNANTLGFYFNITLLLSFFFFLREKKKNMIYLFIAVLFFVSILMTQSKASLLIALITILLYSFRSGFVMFLALPIVGLLLYSIQDLILLRIEGSSASNNDRMSLIEHAFYMVQQSPILGIGPKGYSLFFSDMQTSDAHNAYFNIAAEAGVFASALFLLLYFLVLFKLHKNRPRINKDLYTLLTVFIVTFLLYGNVTGLIYSDKVPWLILSISIAAIYKYIDFPDKSMMSRNRKVINPSS